MVDRCRIEAHPAFPSLPPSLPPSLRRGGFVTIRWRADDYTGMSLAHCHIFSHSDTGKQGEGGREGGRVGGREERAIVYTAPISRAV